MVVIVGAEEHFRSHVLVGAAEGRAGCLDVVSAPPKVTQFYVVGVI